MIADTSGLLAFFNAEEPAHTPVVTAVEASDEPLVVSPFVIAELDYLVASRYGVDAELAVLEELMGGAWLLAPFDHSDLEKAVRVVARYRDQDIGVADASLVVLADRFGTRRLLTLDRRHFEVVRPRHGGRFTIIP
ncbi:MAG: PIN domain-containing protein [Acidimicrobiia bacterium]|nr:PIN domain-containing protein [Acidimicrobiia bacterium]